MMRRNRRAPQDADLDITSFMNLMIILVPVLLMNMVFARITVLEIKLPDLNIESVASDPLENKTLEVVINNDFIDVNYPAGVKVKRIVKAEKTVADNGMTRQEKVHDYDLLSLTLQEIKRQLKEKGIEKRDLLLLSQHDTDYQTLVTTMDTVRSFKTVLVTSVVDAELFPEIALGDAPIKGSARAEVN